LNGFNWLNQDQSALYVFPTIIKILNIHGKYLFILFPDDVNNTSVNNTYGDWSNIPIIIIDGTSPEEYFPIDDEMLEVPKTPPTTTTAKP